MLVNPEIASINNLKLRMLCRDIIMESKGQIQFWEKQREEYQLEKESLKKELSNFKEDADRGFWYNDKGEMINEEPTDVMPENAFNPREVV